MRTLYVSLCACFVLSSCEGPLLTIPLRGASDGDEQDAEPEQPDEDDDADEGPPMACVVAGDCSGEKPFCARFLCVECRQSSDCRSGEQCDDGECEDTPRR